MFFFYSVSTVMYKHDSFYACTGARDGKCTRSLTHPRQTKGQVAAESGLC